MTTVDPLKKPRRLLVINPNTNSRVTGLVQDVARNLAVPGIHVKVVNPRQGPFAIESVSDREDAEPRVIDMIRAASDTGTQGFALACFDDIGVPEARRISAGPVLDACEAAIMVARSLTDRFSIVTTVESAVARIERQVVRYAASASCKVHSARIGVADAASGAGEAKLHATIADALSEDGAKAIILGSGGLAGRANDLSKRFGVPVIDGVAAAISLCQSILSLGEGTITPAAQLPSSRR